MLIMCAVGAAGVRRDAADGRARVFAAVGVFAGVLGWKGAKVLSLFTPKMVLSMADIPFPLEFIIVLGPPLVCIAPLFIPMQTTRVFDLLQACENSGQNEHKG